MHGPALRYMRRRVVQCVSIIYTVRRRAACVCAIVLSLIYPREHHPAIIHASRFMQFTDRVPSIQTLSQQFSPQQLRVAHACMQFYRNTTFKSCQSRTWGVEYAEWWNLKSTTAHSWQCVCHWSRSEATPGCGRCVDGTNSWRFLAASGCWWCDSCSEVLSMHQSSVTACR